MAGLSQCPRVQTHAGTDKFPRSKPGFVCARCRYRLLLLVNGTVSRRCDGATHNAREHDHGDDVRSHR